MAKRKKSNNPYYGVLAKPLAPLTQGQTIASLLRGEALVHYAHPLAHPKNEAALEHRLDALFSHFLLEFGDWQGLALRLALEHVPGFQVMRAKPGAPRKREGFDNELIAIELDAMKREYGLRGASAARAIVKKGSWRAVTSQWKTLQRRAQAASPKIKLMLLDAVRGREGWSPDEGDKVVSLELIDKHYPVVNGRRSLEREK